MAADMHTRHLRLTQVCTRDREATARVWGWLNSSSPPHSRADSAGIALETLAMRTPSGSCTGLTPPEPVPTVSSVTQRTSDSPRAPQPAASGPEGLQPAASGHEGLQAAGPAQEGLHPAASYQECCSAGALRGARLSAPLDDGGSTSGRAAWGPQRSRLEEAVSVSNPAPLGGRSEKERSKADERLRKQESAKPGEVGGSVAKGQACDARPLADKGAADGRAGQDLPVHAEAARPGLLRRAVPAQVLEQVVDPAQAGTEPG